MLHDAARYPGGSISNERILGIFDPGSCRSIFSNGFYAVREKITVTRERSSQRSEKIAAWESPSFNGGIQQRRFRLASGILPDASREQSSVEVTRQRSRDGILNGSGNSSSECIGGAHLQRKRPAVRMISPMSVDRGDSASYTSRSGSRRCEVESQETISCIPSGERTQSDGNTIELLAVCTDIYGRKYMNRRLVSAYNSEDSGERRQQR
ncbi:hypothetical protein F4774DRAFT_409167 [Daldinia eschscholtzii]|nr:hypothetical protein F4774DRAFT_409167 [Daldinia eschscholtzii]